MRALARIAAVSVLALALLSCSRERAPPPPAQSTVLPVSLTAPAATAAVEDQVLYAFHLLMTFYVEPPDANRLLSAAWTGALAAVRPDFLPPAGLALYLSTGQAQSEKALASALNTLLSLAPASVDRQAVALAAVATMAKSLADDHTYFLQPDPYQLYLANETVGLAFSGVNRPDGVLAWYVYEGGPADRAGIRPGDVIRTIDGKPAARERDSNEPDFFEAGVPARLVVDRPNAGRFEVTVVPEQSQRRILGWRVIGDVGYLRLYRFPPPQLRMPDGQTLPAYLDSALADLRGQGVKSFILDLRNNSGGSEVVAANVAGRFGLKGTLVENRRRDQPGATIDAIGQSGLGGLPLLVLINENSASSSELVAAALQQQGLARIVGQNSSGIVNTARTWSVDEGGLFITTERAYAGQDRAYLDRAGVAPDETVTLSRSDLAAGHDTQLERAIEWLRSHAAAAVAGR
jgi:carboxyl-terminal processing protease